MPRTGMAPTLPSAVSRPAALRHTGSPVIRLEEGTIVFLTDAFEYCLDSPGRAELPPQGSLLFSHLLVQRRQQAGALLVYQSVALLGGDALVQRARKPPGERDGRRLGRLLGVPLPVRDNVPEVAVSLGLPEHER